MEEGREEKEGEKRWKEEGACEVGDEPEPRQAFAGRDNKETRVFVMCLPFFFFLSHYSELVCSLVTCVCGCVSRTLEEAAVMESDGARSKRLIPFIL